ncbi:hypothetical protein F2Q68_00038226 [Brassica cretica]|uniref:GB1/RHD3-type G domain-containing protein n=1 Tax=Brassica cretica TaxID=69181 RepID=A0A8S9MGL9_BRACR|nr:hypothetical protein F2Q68_00038226 [Brassica cretica]
MSKLTAESGRAIQLVYTDENGKLKTDPEAIGALQKLKGPVAAVSLFGKAQHGKSFIWNQVCSHFDRGFRVLVGEVWFEINLHAANHMLCCFLGNIVEMMQNESVGFEVQTLHRPCTGDIWMWIEPVKRISEDGSEYSLVLLDVQGADSNGVLASRSSQIFGLAILLSSVFIYGPTLGVDDIALDLSRLLEISKHDHVGDANDNTFKGLGQFSPMFVQLMTDIHSETVESGDDVTQNNKVEALRPQLLYGVNALVKFVSERVRPKKRGDSTIVTGPPLAAFTKSFSENVNNSVIPKISSLWLSVEESEGRKACDTATEVYMSSLERAETPQEESMLIEAHNKAVAKALDAFCESSIGNDEVKQRYKRELWSFFAKAIEEKVITEKDAKLATLEQLLSSTRSELKVSFFERVKSELKVKECSLEAKDLRVQVSDLNEKCESMISAAKSRENETQALKQERDYLDKNHLSHVEELGKLCLRLEDAESEASSAKKLADSLRLEAEAAQNNEKSLQTSLAEKCTEIERAKSRIQELEKVRLKLNSEESEASASKELVDSMKREADALRMNVNELQTSLQDKCIEIDQANCRIEELEKICLKLKDAEDEAATAKELASSMKTEVESVRYNENKLQALLQEKNIEIDNLGRQKNALSETLEKRAKQNEEAVAEWHRIINAEKEKNMRVNTMQRVDSFMVSDEATPMQRVKRLKVEASVTSSGSVFETEEDTASQESGRAMSAMTPRRCTSSGGGGGESSSTGMDHSKYTMKKLREEILKHGFGAELVGLKNARKSVLVELYERCVLRKDVWTSDAALVGGGSETSGLSTQIAWGVGAETFAFDAALEGGGTETDCTSDTTYASCLFMLELNFHSGSSITQVNDETDEQE